MTINFDAASIRRARVQEASAYVTSRFYPPLPVEYGELAVEAVDRVNSNDETPLDVTRISPAPRKAYLDPETDKFLVSPADLVDALRLWHLIDSDDES